MKQFGFKETITPGYHKITLVGNLQFDCDYMTNDVITDCTPMLSHLEVQSKSKLSLSLYNQINSTTIYLEETRRELDYQIFDINNLYSYDFNDEETQSPTPSPTPLETYKPSSSPGVKTLQEIFLGEVTISETHGSPILLEGQYNFQCKNSESILNLFSISRENNLFKFLMALPSNDCSPF